MAYTLDISGKEVVCADCKELEQELADLKAEHGGLKQLVREFRKAYRGDSAMDEHNAWHRLSQAVPDEE